MIKANKYPPRPTAEPLWGSHPDYVTKIKGHYTLRFFWYLWRGTPLVEAAVFVTHRACAVKIVPSDLLLLRLKRTFLFGASFPQASAQSAAAEPLRGSHPDYVTKIKGRYARFWCFGEGCPAKVAGWKVTHRVCAVKCGTSILLQ